MHTVLLIGKDFFQNLFDQLLVGARIEVNESARLYLDRGRLHLQSTCDGRCVTVGGMVFKVLAMDGQTSITIPANVLLTRGDGIFRDGVPQLDRIGQDTLVFAEKCGEQIVLHVSLRSHGRRPARFGKAGYHGISLLFRQPGRISALPSVARVEKQYSPSDCLCESRSQDRAGLRLSMRAASFLKDPSVGSD